MPSATASALPITRWQTPSPTGRLHADAASLIDILAAHAQARADQTSFVFLPNGEAEDGRLTFSELDRRVRAVAASLAPQWRARRAVLMFQPGLDFIVAFFGCLAAGVLAVPVYPPRRAEECAPSLAILAAARADVILADAATQATLARLAAHWTPAQPALVLDWLDDAQQVGSRAAAFAAAPPRREDLAFLQFTSGSIGRPKGVMVTHGNILANQDVIRQGFRHDAERTTVVGWLPFYHDMGLVGNIMQPLYLGRPCVLMPPAAFIQRPIRWLKAIARHGATTSGGPNFAYELCVGAIDADDLAAAGPLDLSGWRVAFAGAEPVRADTLERFAAKFRDFGFSQDAFYPCYGMAETTLMLTGPDRARAPRVAALDSGALGDGRAADAQGGNATRVVSCGRPWAGHELAIVDPAGGARLPEGRIGEIWARGASVAAGYADAPEATREQFGATLADAPGEGPWLRTGDLGFLREGELYVTGRLKSLLIVNGRNYYPSDIEDTSCALHAAFRPRAAVFADGDDAQRIVLVQEVYPHLAKKLDPDAMVKLVRRGVLARHGIRIAEVVLTTARIPVTTSGKIRRGECREAWRAGRLAPIRREPA
jgi:acyl-CoA synthetase (AMP-forming)/AMP-acid ligase II